MSTETLSLAIVAPDFPPEIGGMQTYAREIAGELAERDFDVSVFTSEQHRRVHYDEPFRVIPILRRRMYHDLPILLSHSQNFSLWHVMTASYAWMAGHVSPMVVSIHGNDFLNPSPVATLDLRRRWKLPVRSRWDYSWGKWRTARLLKRRFPHVDHTFSNSRYTESEFLKRHPGCRGKTSAPLVGLAESFFDLPETRTAGGGAPRLLTVCRLSERRKNVDRVLESLALLRHRFPFHYTVVGDGSHRGEYQEQARRLGLGDQVTFAGRLSDQQLKSQLSAADLFVLPSSADERSIEGLGIVYLEANAAGAPVLAARAGGAIEAVDEGVSGYFVDDPTVEQIGAALERFLSKEIVFHSEACRAHARKFRWSNVVDHMCTVYRQLITLSSAGNQQHPPLATR